MSDSFGNDAPADTWGTEQPQDAQQESGPAPAELGKEELTKRARDQGWTETTAFDYDAFVRQGGNNADWYGAGEVYEWSEDYGDVGPEIPELERILFGRELRLEQGEHIDQLQIKVDVQGPERIEPVTKFAEANLHPIVLRNCQLAGYNFTTPIQAYTIPVIKAGFDVVAIAQTGSGKTAAYLVPILSKLMGKAKKLAAPRPDVTKLSKFDPRAHGVRAEPLVVIVVPTRELAIQIFDEARRMCYRSMLRPCVAYGGLPLGICREELGKGCDILIASPGRLCDLMDKPDLLSMNRVKFTVIDEADEMLNQDWETELTKIMSGGDTNEDADHQFMMFSATFPKGARELARKFMAKDHYRIQVGRAGQAHKNIRQNIVYADQDAKREATYNLLMSMETPGRTLIFCNSKAVVDLLDDFLYNRGLPTTSIHADRNQREREDALRAFRTGRAPILIATGVSARGWDVKDVVHVINYDLPSSMYGGISEYVHRIGRTGRIGHQGLATSFYNDRDEDMGQALVNILVECECEVPDFLSHLAPEDGQLQFDDDTDDEAEGEDGGVAWGGAAEGDGDAPAASGWGAPEPAAAADDGFQADTGFTPAGGAAPANDGW
ncbi:hypothetical protein PRZ48_013379 [Zasmidium cellare]|uniref:RNA helicase n=1 Tax=Zasmidium cellare TaxID=395010 RepID=A0ABR0E0U9_ZASCE|nr:hypothetical protein PRZ48_013379 [Zasmidium cellare]